MMKLASLIVFCQQFPQDLLVAGLAAGDTVQVAAGGLADGHALRGKGTGHIAQIALVLGRGGTVKFYTHDFPHLHLAPIIQEYEISARIDLHFHCPY